MKGKKCTSCKYYEDAPTSGYGYCHRHPRPLNARLKVDDNYWCGDYSSKGGKK